MTKAEEKKLETILAKTETLQNQTHDYVLRERLGAVKSDMLRALRECIRERGATS